MPGVDWIPLVSHLKASIQAVTGDVDGAMKTIDNFHKECPGFSQATSLVQYMNDDVEGAKETQRRCLGTINNTLNGTPIVGHMKAVGHLLAGDDEGANKALNAANRSTVVAASGAAAAVTTGGIAAIPAAVTAGAWYDMAATKITGKDQGCIASLRNAIENPSAGTIFDAAAGVVGDGLAGYAGGQLADQLANGTPQTPTTANQAKLSSLENARAAKLDMLNGELGGGGRMTTNQYVALGNEIKGLTSEITFIKEGTPTFWTDLKPTTTSQPVTVPIVGIYDQNSETTQKLPSYVKERENLLHQTTTNASASTSKVLNPGIDEINPQNNKTVLEEKPMDVSIIQHYNYQQKETMLKLNNDPEPERTLHPDCVPFLKKDLENVRDFTNRQRTEPEKCLGWSWLHSNLSEGIFSYTIRLQRKEKENMFLGNEDEIDYDSCADDLSDGLFTQHHNYQDMQNTLKLHDEQKPEGKLSLDLVPLFSIENLNKVHAFNNRQPNDPKNHLKERDLNRLLGWSWLHLNLPEDLFSYTAFVQLNNESEGLYHSLIRHFDQWGEFISFDQELINQLSPIMNHITEIYSVTGDPNYCGFLSTPENSRYQSREVRDGTRDALQRLRNTLRQLSRDDLQNVRRALLRMQVLMHEFVQNNITSCTYIRRVTNAQGEVQLHFKVKTLQGETKIMVICVSKELLEPVTSVDKRPLRRIKTIFFKTWYEDALFYDSYVKNSWDDEDASEDNAEGKQNTLKSLDAQKANSDLDLLSVPLFYKDNLRRVRASNLTNAQEEFLITGRRLWLHLNLPQHEDFSYTAFIQSDSDNEGLFYSLIRHIDEWREFIEFDPQLIGRLSPIINEIENLTSVIEDTTAVGGKHDPKNDNKKVREARLKAEAAREKLRNVLKNLKKEVWNNLNRALLRIQVLLYDFMENNITSCTYIRRTIDGDGLEQLHFKVTTLTGETRVMVICVSIDLFKPVSSVDQRPIRKVMAVFFKSWDGDFE